MDERQNIVLWWAQFYVWEVQHDTVAPKKPPLWTAESEQLLEVYLE